MLKLLERQFFVTGRRHCRITKRGIQTKATGINLSRFSKPIKYASALLILLPVTLVLGVEATHAFIENNGMKPLHENNDDIRRWQWDQDTERWNADLDAIGTDPGLSKSAANLIRSAWAAQHFFPTEHDFHSPDPSLSPSCLRAAQYLIRALHRIEKDPHKDQLHQYTYPEMLFLYSTLLEQAGPPHWPTSINGYAMAHPMFPSSGIRSALTALKVGNISSRMGDASGALEWWTHSAQSCTGTQSISDNPLDWLTNVAEVIKSPALQRIFTSVLVSVSANLASSGQYEHALKLEEQTLHFLRSLPTPSLSSASPSEALHHLYLLQRSSLLCIHAAEVAHAQKSAPSVSLEWLDSAIQTSQRIFKHITPDEANPSPTHDRPAKFPIKPPYPSSLLLSTISEQLIHDTCRATAEAHNLSGLLLEQTNPQAALGHFTKALWWASAPGQSGPALGILRSDFDSIRDNLQRSQATMKSESIA